MCNYSTISIWNNFHSAEIEQLFCARYLWVYWLNCDLEQFGPSLWVLFVYISEMIFTWLFFWAKSTLMLNIMLFLTFMFASLLTVFALCPHFSLIIFYSIRTMLPALSYFNHVPVLQCYQVWIWEAAWLNHLHTFLFLVSQINLQLYIFHPIICSKQIFNNSF